VPTPIRILVGDVVLAGELHDGPTGRAIAEALPLEETLRSFGDSYYMETPVSVPLEPDAGDEVDVGDIAYWPAALAVSFFFGPTPESAPGSDRPVAASDVTKVGRFEDAPRLRDADGATRIRIERA